MKLTAGTAFADILEKIACTVASAAVRIFPFLEPHACKMFGRLAHKAGSAAMIISLARAVKAFKAVSAFCSSSLPDKTHL